MRWRIPRGQFPMGRAGYLKWRTTLYDFHADEAGKLLREVGYDEPTIQRVRSLIRKERIKSDPEMQLLEDVICLVFLETQFDALAAQLADDDKMIEILRKTVTKMSPEGLEAAGALPLSAEGAALLGRALAGAR